MRNLLLIGFMFVFLHICRINSLKQYHAYIVQEISLQGVKGTFYANFTKK